MRYEVHGRPPALGSCEVRQIDRDDLGQVFQAVIEKLQRVMRVVGEDRGLFGDQLVIVGGLEQPRRPGLIAVGIDRLVRGGGAIAVAVDEEIGIGG